MRPTDGCAVPRVRRNPHCLLLLLGLALLAGPGVAAAPDEAVAAVKRDFAVYQNALERGDGAAAVAAVSNNSLSYYDRMRRLALHAGRGELAQLEGTQRMLVLSLRHTAPLELLQTGSGKDLVAYAVDTGIVSDTSVVKTQLGEVTLKGDRARCWIVIDGEPTRGVMQFVREDERWKFDLEFAMGASVGSIAALATQSGMTEDAVILQLLSQAAGKPVDAKIWEPLLAP